MQKLKDKGNKEMNKIAEIVGTVYIYIYYGL